MQAIRQLQEAGQSVWLDTVSRAGLEDGTTHRFVRELAVSGLRTHFGAFGRALRESAVYDESLLFHLHQGKRGEALLVEEALEDLTRAAALLLPLFHATQGREGWVALALPPGAVLQPARAVEQAILLHGQAGLPNLLIEIPATEQGVRVIQEAIFCGVPVSATQIFSEEQFLAAADAWMKGIERRIALGRSPDVRSVASVQVSPWDDEVAAQAPPELRDRLGVSVGARIYAAWSELAASARGRSLERAGATLQRLLWAEDGDSRRSYVQALAAPGTIHCLSDDALVAFAERGRVERQLFDQLGEAEALLGAWEAAGFDLEDAAEHLQRRAVQALVRSWRDLVHGVEEKAAAMRSAEHAHVTFYQSSSSSRSA